MPPMQGSNFSLTVIGGLHPPLVYFAPSAKDFSALSLDRGAIAG